MDVEVLNKISRTEKKYSVVVALRSSHQIFLNPKDAEVWFKLLRVETGKVTWTSSIPGVDSRALQKGTKYGSTPGLMNLNARNNTPS